MKRCLNDCSVWFLSFAMASLFASNGCSVPNPTPAPVPPASTDYTSTIGNGTMSIIHGYDGLSILICSDIAGGSSMSTTMTGSSPPVQKSVGYAASQDERRLDWLIEKRNGQKTTCRLNNKDFDLQKGTLFLVKTKGGETKIDQLTQDLSEVSPDTESFTDFAKKNSEVSALLEVAEEEKSGE